MKLSRRNALIAGGALLSSAALAEVVTPRKKLSEELPSFDLRAAIPINFGEWRQDTTLVPIAVSPDVEQVLNRTYDQLVSQTYIANDGYRVMLSVAYGSAQTRQLRAHRQEVCYSAQGFQIRELRRVRLDVMDVNIPATRMVARMGGRVEPVLYWFTMGDQAVLSLWDRQRVQFEYSLRGLIPDGFLVRFSSIDPEPERAFVRLQAFGKELFPHVDPSLAARMVGLNT